MGLVLSKAAFLIRLSKYSTKMRIEMRLRADEAQNDQNTTLGTQLTAKTLFFLILRLPASPLFLMSPNL